MNKPLERRSLPVRQSALADVQVELTLFTFNKLMITIMLSGIGLIGATWMLAYHYHDPVLWILGGVMTLIWVARAAVVVSFPGESATDNPLRQSMGAAVRLHNTAFLHNTCLLDDL